MVSQWYYSGVTVVSQWCYSGVTMMSQWCYNGVTMVSQWYYSGVSQWCYMVLSFLHLRTKVEDSGITMALQCSKILKVAVRSVVLQWSYSYWCYNSVTLVLQRCNSGVTLVTSARSWRSGAPALCPSPNPGPVTVVLQWCYSGVTVVLQWCSAVL
jgi:hypothetical protein